MRMLKVALAGVSLAVAMMLGGCAQTLAHRNLEVNTKVSSSIDLNADVLSQGKPIYLLIRDQSTSKGSGPTLETLVAQKLQAKGYTITKKASQAGYRLQGTLLYMDKEKDGMTNEGALAAGFGGAIIGGDRARYNYGNNDPSLSTSGKTSFLTTGLGSLAGSLVSVDSWYGIADITIEEPLPHAVKKRTVVSDQRSSAKVNSETSKSRKKTGNRVTTSRDASLDANSNAEASSMEYEESATHKKLKTRVVGTATQTNIDAVVAERELKEYLSNAIANFF